MPVLILIPFLVSWAEEIFAVSSVCIEVSSTLFNVGRQVCVDVGEVFFAVLEPKGQSFSLWELCNFD